MNIIFQKQDLIDRVTSKIEKLKAKDEENRKKWYESLKKNASFWADCLSAIAQSEYEEIDSVLNDYFTVMDGGIHINYFYPSDMLYIERVLQSISDPDNKNEVFELTPHEYDMYVGE